MILKANRNGLALRLSILLILLLLTDLVKAQTTNIGVVLPLTGGASSNGQSIMRSMKLADEQFDVDQKFTFIFEDDQLLPKKTVTAVNKLIYQNHVDGLIVFGSPTSLAVNGIAESAKIPMIAMSIVDRVVEGKEYVVKHWVTAKRENEILVKEVRRKRITSVAIVSTVNDAMLNLRDLFVRSKVANVTLNEEFSPEELDFKATAAKIKNQNPDAVYLLLWAPQTGSFAKQLRQIGYTGMIFGAHNLENFDEVAVSAGSLNGAWYVTGDDRAGKEFYQFYKTRYESLPSNGGINAYDCAKLMIEGVQSGNLRKYLTSVQGFHGAYGNYGATGNNDFNIPATIKYITEKGFSFDAP